MRKLKTEEEKNNRNVFETLTRPYHIAKKGDCGP